MSTPGTPVPLNALHLVPPHAHRLILFLSTALYRHDLIFTQTNRHHVEQWLELVARYYLFDRSATERRCTWKMVQKHHTHVWKNAEAVIQFEQILRNKKTAQMQRHEDQLREDWKTLTTEWRRNRRARTQKRSG